ncbi:MAG TPA: diaminopimelate epimerase [Acidimicrobiales bacterium]|nr:diaminopimelate epimerase [Acidimicrobiales bacterium]
MKLTKHHGLGNDFLVALDLAREPVGPFTPEQVVAVCHRTQGVGADGLLWVTPSSKADLAMVLHNADGSRAEMSGNGISCVGQAALLQGVVEGPEFTVASDVGIKTLTLERQGSPTRHTLRVDLGAVIVGDLAADWTAGPITHAQWIDVGNPHLVLAVSDHEAVDLVDVGSRVNAEVAGGANVETIVCGPDDQVSMRVFERGVGLTDACGTGACASAAAAHAWGMAGRQVVVHQPGGDATVELGSTTHYTVEVEAIARVEWPWA